ncbi:pilus assembly protein PilP, partial [Myxococcota bacterium]|nr:pilus assembly protein PilP [Myxococcota bacterium]
TAGASGGEVAQKGDEEVSEIAYAYSPIGKRDPFRSLFDQLRREEQNQQLTELQTFEVDQLKLVAIVSRIATPYAMVEDPTGKGHTLTRGTLIGKNWGRVSEINPDCVVIKEEYRDYTGRKVTNKISVCLPKPEDLKID